SGRKPATSNHVQSTCVRAFPEGGFLRKSAAMSKEIAEDAAMAPVPKTAVALRGQRDASEASINALPNGMAGTSQRSFSISSPHFARRVRIQHFVLMVEAQHECQTH